MRSSADMSKYAVIIGEDEFRVEAKNNQEAGYVASEAFREKYQLPYSLKKIVYFARSLKLHSPNLTTKSVLRILAEGEGRE